ncbi:hypothetical protein J6590_071890 [Homalodisca vitripennis]|nr:hypothetical protein J6590_071890 [Homalodisca vitripennis]
MLSQIVKNTDNERNGRCTMKVVARVELAVVNVRNTLTFRQLGYKNTTGGLQKIIEVPILHTLLVFEGEDGIWRLHRICPDESDCELFLSSVKYFLLELAGTLAGLSWGAWSTLVFVINQIES